MFEDIIVDPTITQFDKLTNLTSNELIKCYGYGEASEQIQPREFLLSDIQQQLSTLFNRASVMQYDLDNSEYDSESEIGKSLMLNNPLYFLSQRLRFLKFNIKASNVLLSDRHEGILKQNVIANANYLLTNTVNSYNSYASYGVGSFLDVTDSIEQFFFGMEQ